MGLPNVAFIGTGGTIASVGETPFDLQDYGANRVMMHATVAEGVVVLQCTRAGSGRTFRGQRLRDAGVLISDNLTPQKARVLRALALTRTSKPEEIERIFLTY